MPIEAIIFDNDGLLVDSEPVWDQARAAMAAESGKNWNTDDHKAVMGVSTQEWADYMIERLELDMPVESVVDEIISRMQAMYAERVPYMPGAVAAVNYAVGKLPSGVASGSHPALLSAVMNDDAMRGKFQMVLSADDESVARGKPHPDVYLETAKRMGVKPENCVCLEDSGNGILAGKNAGMIVIAVPDERFPPSPEKLQAAHHVLKSLHGFPALLEQLLTG